eukprot:Partr_v1_DN24068_c0_g1_i1_m34542 putative RNP domain protein
MYDNTITTCAGVKWMNLISLKIPFTTQWTELKDLFAEVGEVAFADVPRNNQTNRARGYGIVRFNTVEAAKLAIEKFNGYEFNGRELTVREDQHSERPPRNAAPASKHQVFVGNLSWSTTWQELKDLATEHGLQPSRSDVAMGNDGRSRGWGTLGFETEEQCAQAISALNGLEVGGRAIEVREDRKPVRG